MIFLKSKRIKELENALFESVKLQSHYASLLNQYDGGNRLIFNTPKEWIDRLRYLHQIDLMRR